MLKILKESVEKLPRSGFVHQLHIFTHFDNHRIVEYGKIYQVKDTPCNYYIVVLTAFFLT